jgi:CRISPR-associated protein Cas7/Cse4/CasC subtype I-E
MSLDERYPVVLIEIHVLQNFAPSNLNRDDTGSPKDCEFGGYRRARISSQCIKRNVRWHPAVQKLAEATFARRSNMHARQIAQILADDRENPRHFEEAYNVGRYMFQRMGFKEKKERLTVMLLLGADEIRTIGKAAADNWDIVAPLSNASVLWERLANQLAGYLTDLGDDAEMLGWLIANHKAGSANASALQKWLDLPATVWDDTLATVRQMPDDFRQELRDKFNTEEEGSEEGRDEEEYVPKPAAALFKNKKKNKEVVDKLAAIDIRAERGQDKPVDDTGKKDLTKKLNNIFKPLKRLTTKAVDVALFGRMIAEIKDGAMNIDAACQVAHAISTHRIVMESDYFTAVEELKEIAEKQGVGQDAGAGMIGTVEFNSACYYRYASIDVGQLVQNLQSERDVAQNAAKGFLTGFIHAIPTGKQNSFAAHNPPSLVFAVVRDGPPVSLANAFVEPARPDHTGNLILNSVRKLDRYYGKFAPLYGEDDRMSAAMWCEFDDDEIWSPNGKGKETSASLLKGFRQSSWEEVIATVTEAAFPDGGAS